MRELKLTRLNAGATNAHEDGPGQRMDKDLAKRVILGLSAALGALALSGCINVNAPEEPIVIQLDINIRAEVLYRLAEDASNTIDENADIF